MFLSSWPYRPPSAGEEASGRPETTTCRFRIVESPFTYTARLIRFFSETYRYIVAPDL